MEPFFVSSMCAVGWGGGGQPWCGYKRGFAGPIPRENGKLPEKRVLTNRPTARMSNIYIYVGVVVRTHLFCECAVGE